VAGERAARVWTWIAAAHVGDPPVSIAALCRAAVLWLGVDGAGVTATSGLLAREPLFASDELTARLEELQFTTGEGPGSEDFRFGSPVLIPDLDSAAARWPGFAPAAVAAGAGAIFVLPLQAGAIQVGLLSLYRTQPGSMTPEQLADMLVFAEMALQMMLDAQAGISGEAGIGKTAVIDRFLEQWGRQVGVLRGWCDPLSAPRPLGPLIDMVAQLPGEQAAGLALAQPQQASAVFVGSSQTAAAHAPRSMAFRLLDAVPLFVSLSDDEKEALAATMTRRTYRKDDLVVEQDANMKSLMIIRSGVLVVSRREQDREVELSRLAPGDYFGEDGLFTGSCEEGTIRALTAVVAYEVEQAALAKLVHDRPSIADEVSITLSRRAKRGQALLSDKERTAALAAVPGMVARIRQLFELPHS